MLVIMLMVILMMVILVMVLMMVILMMVAEKKSGQVLNDYSAGATTLALGARRQNQTVMTMMIYHHGGDDRVNCDNDFDGGGIFYRIE